MLDITKIIFIFALWIGWSSYQPIRGKSIAPSTSLMIDVKKMIDNMKEKKHISRKGGSVPHYKKRSLIHGVGVNDVRESTSLHGNHKKTYGVWKSIIERCYACARKKRMTSYRDCIVCEDWKYYSNFKKWYDNPMNGYKEGYHLDKDILVKGNKVYSPETCCFVPQEINTMLVKQKSRRGNLPIGVAKTDGKKFRAIIRKHQNYITIGRYNTPEEAFDAYKQVKEAHIKEVAQSYFDKGLITEKVYNALMNYKVEITD